MVASRQPGIVPEEILMKKHLANILSTLRIITAALLLWYGEFTVSFLRLFSFAGLTDLLDGPIARLTKSVSTLGSKLDTAGDVLLYVAVAKILLIKKKIRMRYFLIIISAMLALLISAFIGLSRFGDFFFIHTVSGKLLGVNCFLLPFASFGGILDISILIISVLFVILAVESLVIQTKSSVPSPDARTVLSIHFNSTKN